MTKMAFDRQIVRSWSISKLVNIKIWPSKIWPTDFLIRKKWLMSHLLSLLSQRTYCPTKFIPSYQDQVIKLIVSLNSLIEPTARLSWSSEFVTAIEPLLACCLIQIAMDNRSVLEMRIWRKQNNRKSEKSKDSFEWTQKIERKKSYLYRSKVKRLLQVSLPKFDSGLAIRW